MTAQDAPIVVPERDETPVPLGDHPRLGEVQEDRAARTPPHWSTEPPRRPSAGDFTSERMLRAQAEPARSGWRRVLFQLTGGLVNLGPSPTELRERDLAGRVKAPVQGCRRIAVVSRKGGVGKTTTTLMLGHTFASLRGDRVIALDGNPDAGSLAYRVRRETTNTIMSLLAHRENIVRYADIRAYTNQAPTRLEVVAADDDERAEQPRRDAPRRLPRMDARAVDVEERHVERPREALRQLMAGAHLQRRLDDGIKAAGVDNAYFPLLIPESYLHREAEHVEGFSPELAVVTHGGGKQLDEPAVIRPTSETIINSYFAKWIESYRDLPLKINNWSNVVRWELRPRLFLRTTEFLWQEGHTAHRTADDAQAFALEILHDVYEATMVETMAIPVLTGLKTDREKFAGAMRSWSCEGVMRDGKALQMGTSHELAQGFARAFDMTFLDVDGSRVHPWQTSWGVSTRLLGALIMVHGDDAGLRLPPPVAPVQVVVMLVKEDVAAGERAAALVAALRDAGVRVRLDDRVETSFGRRAVEWELKGVPVRVELGPRDVAAGQATLVRRAEGTKAAVPIDEAAARCRAALDAEQALLLDEARALRERLVHRVDTLDAAREAARDGLAALPLTALGTDGEAQLAEHGISIRCLRRPDGARFAPDERDLEAIVGRAY